MQCIIKSVLYCKMLSILPLECSMSTLSCTIFFFSPNGQVNLICAQFTTLCAQIKNEIFSWLSRRRLATHCIVTSDEIIHNIIVLFWKTLVIVPKSNTFESSFVPFWDMFLFDQMTFCPYMLTYNIWCPGNA